MKRIFIAIKIEAGMELQRMTTNLKALLGNESIKWVDFRNLHLTLVFLGDTDKRRIASLINLLNDKCSGFGEFEFTLAGTGVFRNFRDPRVIWAGINQHKELIRLSEIIINALMEKGYDFDEKPLRPHITLGRIKSIRDIQNLKKIMEKYCNVELQIVNVKEVILFESILKQTGPIYNPLARFPLN